jgi:CCR4-NOT transcriptional complex subunit CAF120
MSFMSSFSNRDTQRNLTPASPPSLLVQPPPLDTQQPYVYGARPGSPSSAQPWTAEPRDSRQSRPARERVPGERVVSRPMSMVQTYQPPLMELNQDTLPELQPIFTYLNSHGNKLYQEGYFLKLDDQNIRRNHH